MFHNFLPSITTVTTAHDALSKLSQFALVVVSLDDARIDYLRNFRSTTHFITVTARHTITTQMLNRITYSIRAGAIDCCILHDEEALKKRLLPVLLDNCNAQDIAQTKFIKKSNAMRDCINTLKSLMKAHIISLIGEAGSGKKFLLQWHFQKNKETFQLINCHNLQLLNVIDEILNKQLKCTIVIDHPELLNESLQQEMVNKINKTIGNDRKIKWFFVLGENYQETLIDVFRKRIEIFVIHMPTLNERKNDLPLILDAIKCNLEEINVAQMPLQDWRLLKTSPIQNLNAFKTILQDVLSKNRKKLAYTLTIDGRFLEMPLKEATNLFAKLYFKQHMEKKLKLNQIAHCSGLNRTTIYRKMQN
jgi:DNA-binding NtrC family response regulator